MSDDAQADRNVKLKAAMRDQKTGNLNTGPAQVPCGPKQGNTTQRPTGHIEPASSKRS